MADAGLLDTAHFLTGESHTVSAATSRWLSAVKPKLTTLVTGCKVSRQVMG